MEENKNPKEDIKTTPSGVVNDPADDKAPKKEAASSAGGESDTAAPEGDKSDAPEQKNSTKGSGGGRRRRLPRAISIPLKVLMWIVIAVLLIPVALYIPPVQTFVKNIACKMIKSSTGMDVEIDRFRLKFPLDVSLQGVKVIEATGDTMVMAKEVVADVALLPLLKLDVDVRQLSLHDGYYRMVSPDSSMIMKIRAGLLDVEPGAKVEIKQSNILLRKARLVDGDVSLYMNVWKQESTPPDTTTTPFYISLDELQAERLRFAMSMLPTIDTLVLNADKLQLRKGIINLRTNDITADLLSIGGGDARYIAPTPEYVAAHPVPVDSTAVPSAPMTIKADSIAIDKFAALYAIKGAKPLPGFDANYIQVKDVGIGLRGFYNQQANLRLPITRLTATERSGLHLTSGSGLVALNEAGIDIDALQAATPYSRIGVTAGLPFALMELQPSAPVNVNISGMIGIKDAVTFMPDMAQYVKPVLGRTLNVNVDAKGQLDNVNISQLDLAMPGIFSLRADGTARNVLDMNKLVADVNFNGELMSPATIEEFVPDMPFHIPTLTLRGRAGVDGANYDADFSLLTSEGDIVGGGNVGLNSERYYADINVRNLNVAHFMPDLGIGHVSATLEADGAGFNPVNPGAHTDVKLNVAGIDYGGKHLRDITLHALLASHNFTIDLDSPNEDANVSGHISGSVAKDEYCGEGYIKIYNADLQAFGLSEDTNYGSADLRFDVTARPARWLYDVNIDADEIDWHLPTDDLLLPEGLQLQFIADASNVMAHLDAKGAEVDFYSPQGLESVVDGFTKAMDVVMRQIKEQNVDFEEMHANMPQFNLEGKLSGRGILNEVLRSSGMAIDTVAFTLGNDSLIRGGILAERINTGSMVLDTLTLGLLERGKLIDYKLTLGNRGNGPLAEFAKVNLNGYVGQNRLSAYLTQKNQIDKQGYRFGFTAAVADSVVSLHFTPLKATIAYLPWQFNDDNHIDYSLADGRIDANLMASSNESSILMMTEAAPDGGADNLHVNLKNIHIQDFLQMSLLAPPVQGDVDADIRLQYDGKSLNGSGDLSLRQLVYDKMMVGDFDIGLNAGVNFQGKTEAEAALKVNGKPALSLSTILEQQNGSLEPTTVDLNLTEFPLSVANAFLGPDVAKLGGTLNGKLNMSGSMSQPLLNGDIECDAVDVFIPMIGSSLKIDNSPIMVVDNLLTFNKFNIFGANNNPLQINGNVDARKLSDIRFDLDANAENFALINNTAKANSDLYGKLFLNLTAGVKGPMSHFDVSANVNVLGTSDFTYQVPLTTATQLSNTTAQDVVKFVNFADTTTVATDSLASVMAMRIRAAATISSGTVVNVVIPNSASGGGKVQLSPSGTLNFFQNFMGDMTLNGELMLGNGYAKYKVPVIGEKNFVFNPQSYVQFNGDIMNPILNIDATENMRASVVNSSGNSNMVNFLIGLSVTNTLSNPKVVFDLSTDDDITLKNELESMTPDQRSTQAMNLLVTGRYQGAGLKTMQGNVGENMLYSLVESSLNSLASKYVKGVDLSFGIDQYDTSKNGQEGSATSYSYQLSKSLFSNKFKIVVGGNYSTDASADENLAQNLISDISFEYMLKQTNSLSMLVRLFRHVGFENVLEGEVTETGVGFTMRRRISDLRRLFKVRWGKRKNPAMNVIDTDSVPAENTDSTQRLTMNKN